MRLRWLFLKSSYKFLHVLTSSYNPYLERGNVGGHLSTNYLFLILFNFIDHDAAKWNESPPRSYIQVMQLGYPSYGQKCPPMAAAVVRESRGHHSDPYIF